MASRDRGDSAPNRSSLTNDLSPNLDDRSLVVRLLQGDEAAFLHLVRALHPGMVRMAAHYVRDRATAEDVAQQTWLDVLKGLHHFAFRSSLRTWIFAILLNLARRRGARERQSPRAEQLPARHDLSRHTVPAESPEGWRPSISISAASPESIVLSKEIRALVEATIAHLPSNQRLVVTLRDVEGVPAAEVCSLLGISSANQRVLLHRARQRLRKALAPYFDSRPESE